MATYFDPMPGSGIDTATFKAWLDGVDVTAKFAVGAGQATWMTTESLADGPHIFAARIADKAGNVAEKTSLFRIASVLATVGSSGGTLSVTDLANPISGSSLSIPEGALTQTIAFSIELVAGPIAFPPGFVPAGPVVDFRPSVRFVQPVMVAIPYSDAVAQTTGVPEAGLKLLRFDVASATWILVPISHIDTVSNLVYAQVTELAGVEFGVAGQIADAQQGAVTAVPAQLPADGFSTSVITVTPKDMEGNLLGPNQSVTVSVVGVGTVSPVQDLGNGNYQAFLNSLDGGGSKVQATVNGILLATQPDVVFLPAYPDLFSLEGYTSPLEAGVASDLTITAKLASGAVLTTFTGVVAIHLTGTKDAAGTSIYPESFLAVFTESAQGVLVLPNAIVFAQAGIQQVKVMLLAKPEVVGLAQVVVGMGSDATLTRIAGDNQAGAAGTLLSQPLVTRVTDLFGNPIAGATVNYQAASGGAVFVTGTAGGGISGVITKIAGGLVDGGPATDAPLAIMEWVNQVFAGIASDSSGSLFIADNYHHVIRNVSSSGTISTVAGSGMLGYSGDGGPALGARFWGPAGLWRDASGNLYIADLGNYRVRRVSAGGIVTTFAGTGETGFGGDGGPATSAPLVPSAVSGDSQGRIYVCDALNGRIRRIDQNGTITTVAGGGSNNPSAGGQATSASLSLPFSIALSGDILLYLTDRVASTGQQRVLRVDLSSGTISVLTTFPVSATPSNMGIGISTDAGGNVLAAVSGLHRVYKITPAGTMSVFAGTGVAGFSGDGGLATAAKLREPSGVAVGPSGSVYIADSKNLRIRQVNAAGVISTAAGNGTYAYGGDNGPATNAAISGGDLVADGLGNIYIADEENHRIRRIGTNGIITTIAGNGVAGSTGDGGPATSASVAYPRSVALDPLGNLYFAEGRSSFFKVRKINPSGTISTIPNLARMVDLAVDAAGDLYAADSLRVWKWTPSTGTVSWVAGTATPGFSGDGGPATLAQFAGITEIALDGTGALWILDADNDRIRRVGIDGIVTTIVAQPGMTALAADALGTLYFAETVSTGVGSETASVLKCRTPDGSTTTIAGNGQADGTGDGGTSLEASLTGVTSLSLDSQGSLLLMDEAQDVALARIRRITFGAASAYQTAATVSAMTDANGLAVSPPILLPTTAGASTITASVTGLASVTFTVTAVAAAQAPAAPVILGPTNGSTVSTATPTVSGTGISGLVVTVLADGVPVGSGLVANGAWSFPSAPLAAGAHTLVAYAVDASGVSSIASAPVTVTISVSPLPVPTLAASLTRTNDGTPAIQGVAAPLATILVYANGMFVGAANADSSGAWLLADTMIALPDGVYAITAVTQVGGVFSAASDAALLIVDSVSAAIEFTSPASNVVVSAMPVIGFTMTDTGSGPDPASRKLEAVNAGETTDLTEFAAVTLNDAVNGKIAVTASVPWGAVQDGFITLRASGADLAGNGPSIADRAFVLDRSGPTILLATPAPEGQVSSSSVALEATVSDAVSGVVDQSIMVRLNGVEVTYLVQRAAGSSNFMGVPSSVSLSGTLPANVGQNELVVVAADLAGNSTSQTFRFSASAGGAMTRIVVTSSAGLAVTASSRFDLILVAVNESNAVAGAFTGTVQLSASDLGANFPAVAVFAPEDAGVIAIRDASFATPGEQSVAAISPAASGIGRFYVQPNPMDGPRPKRLGDLDGDGQIAQSDVDLLTTFLQSTAAFNPVQELAADMNRDGLVNNLDLAAIAGAAGSVLADAEPPAIQFESPSSESVDREDVQIRVAYSDSGSGVDTASLIVFSERHLSSELAIGPGMDVVRRRPWLAEIAGDRAVIDLPPRSVSIGPNAFGAAILDTAGNIGFAKAQFIASGIEYVHQEGRTAGHQTLLIASFRADQSENVAASWTLVDGEGSLTNEGVDVGTRTAMVNLLPGQLGGVDVPRAVVRVELSATGSIFAADEGIVRREPNNGRPGPKQVTGGFAAPGETPVATIELSPGYGTITGSKANKGDITQNNAPEGGKVVQPVSVSVTSGGERISIRFTVPANAPEGWYWFRVPISIEWRDSGRNERAPISLDIPVSIYITRDGGALSPSKLIDDNLAKIEKWIQQNENGPDNEKAKLAIQLKQVLDKVKAARDPEFPLFTTTSDTALATEGDKVSTHSGKTKHPMKDGLNLVTMRLSPQAFRDEKTKLRTMLHELRHALYYVEVNEEVEKLRGNTTDEEKKKKITAKSLDGDEDGILDKADKDPGTFDDSEKGAHEFEEKYAKAMGL
ncbi:MAG: hypothetical protein HYY17_02685 [Planctomycetes bacterium]|nr:hypothetical protein [Planctomycetota bacterium]